MNERPTPETDDLDGKWDSYSRPFEAIDLSRKLERDLGEAQEYSKATWKSLRDSQDEVLRLTFENRKLTQGIDEALILGNKLADECERILGLGLHQNTTERFKAALEAWKNYNNE